MSISFGSILFPPDFSLLKKYDHVLTTEQILGAMSTSYEVLVAAPGPGKVIVPAGVLVATSRPGTAAFGGNPNVLIGYPGATQGTWFNHPLPNGGLTQLTAQMKASQDGQLSDALSAFTNQPLVVSLSDATATYGPIVSHHLQAAGSGYLAEETFRFGYDTDAAGTILTVDGDGAVLTYRLDTPGNGIPPGVNEILAGGHIRTSSIAAAGSGYRAGDTFTLENGDTYPTGVIDTVVTSGPAATVSIVAGGADYQSGDHVALVGGGGGATLTIGSVSGGGAVLTAGVQINGNPGYIVGTTYTTTTVDGSGNNALTVRVESVIGGGAVLTYHFTTLGQEVSVTVAQVLGGSGSGFLLSVDETAGAGFTINVTQVTQGNGAIKLKFQYDVIEV